MDSLPSKELQLTKDEAEKVVQVFGLRVLDWRRLSDQAAGNWMAITLNKYGADTFFAALARVRKLVGRERGFWLSTIAVVNPKYAHIMKNPPGDWSDDELWRFTFAVLLSDEMGKARQHIESLYMEAALAEQV